MVSHEGITNLFKRIVEAIKKNEGKFIGVKDLMKELGISRPTLDKCLILLQWEDIIKITVVGKKKVIALSNEDKLDEFLEKFKEKRMDMWFLNKSD